MKIGEPDGAGFLGPGHEIGKERSYNMPIGEFFTSAGPGGLVVLAVILLAATIYFLLTRWILAGGKEEEDRYRFR